MENEILQQILSKLTSMEQAQQETNKRLDILETKVNNIEQTQQETNKHLDMLETKVNNIEQTQQETNKHLNMLETKVNNIEQTTIRIEHQHGEKLQALYEGYINNQQSIQSQHEPRISKIENTVENHSLEILALKNAR